MPLSAQSARLALLALLSLACPALADTPAAEAPAPDPAAPTTPASPAWPRFGDPAAWTVQVRPMAWYLSPSGDIGLPNPGGPARIPIEVNDLQLDQPELEPAGEFSIQSGPWRVSFGGGTYSTDVQTAAPFNFAVGSVVAAAGNQVRSELDWTTAQLTVGYRLWAYDFGAQDPEPNPGRTVFRLHALGGARVYDVSFRFSRVTGGPAASAEDDGFWIEPILGAQAELQVVRDFSIDIELTGGIQPFGEDTSSSVDLALAFSWRPGFIGLDGLALQIGWRQLLFDLEEGDTDPFKFDGGFAGLFFGASLRF
jgi:hypothetical protein